VLCKNEINVSIMIYRTDYHMHSSFSDGRSKPEDYIDPAIASGLSEIGFSEHLTLFSEPQNWNMDPSNAGNYVRYLQELSRKTTGIKIRTGLEVDFFEGKEAETKAFLDDLPLDYIIGSVHYLGPQTVDLGPEFYEGKNIDSLYVSYFDKVCAAAASGIFDIIGHCDLIRIYGYRPETDPEPLYRKLARTMKQHNVAFEINTNGRNRPLADFYPDRKYLGIFLQEKVPVCVNSDAHMPSRTGQYFDEAYDLLRYTGFTEMAVFEKRNRRMIPF
jgi:histidinol-phosphatase (PHP family)